MRRFNLLDSPWISVMTDNHGNTEEVSIKELFANAHKYKRMAGETDAQDFAILRLLLAILHTVFSRFDAEGEKYHVLELDQLYRQISDIEDEQDIDDYEAMRLKTWKVLWDAPEFPQIISEYLEKWSDHFYLYDDVSPFYQVSRADLERKGIMESTLLSGKFINRLISESNNKVELFSPASEEYKNFLTDASLARWIVAFQGYTGTSEKKKHPAMEEDKITASKGWLLGLGSVCLSGKTLKETLLLNMVLLPDYHAKETPVWEKSLDEIVTDSLNRYPKNLADLYTNWSRLILMDPLTDMKKKEIEIRTVQLPGINYQDFFLEPMTLWQYPKTGDNKQHFIPKPHNENRALWRSFGQVSLSSSKIDMHRRPGIIDWQNFLVNKNLIDHRIISLTAVGLRYNRDASTMINGEVYDVLNIHDRVLADVSEAGWIPRISDEVSLIKTIVEKNLRNFVKDIIKIRYIKNDTLSPTIVQEAYYEIDIPFLKWLEGIRHDESKEHKIQEWREVLKELIMKQAMRLMKNASKRDYLGIKDSEKTLNIATAYNKFLYQLNKRFEEGR